MWSVLISIISLFVAACGASPMESAGSSLPASQKIMESYHLYFPKSQGTTAELRIDYRGHPIKKSICAQEVNGTPALDKPMSGSIVCDPKNGGVEARFDLQNLGEESFWVGLVRFEHEGVRGGEFSCYHQKAPKNYLDCFWKPDSEPPPAGSVSN